MTTDTRKKKVRGGIIAAGLVAVVAGTAIIGTTMSSFYRTEHSKIQANSANLMADIFLGKEANDLALGERYTTIADAVAATSHATDYNTPALTMTDGDTAFVTDSTRFVDFAPGKVQAISYKLVNTGKVDINLKLYLEANYKSPSDNTFTWDEQDPLPIFDTQVVVKKNATAASASWESLANSTKLGTYDGTKKQVGTTAISVPVGQTLEIIQFVAFPDGGIPAAGTEGDPSDGPNYKGDNQYMNAQFDFELTFELEQP